MGHREFGFPSSFPNRSFQTSQCKLLYSKRAQGLTELPFCALGQMDALIQSRAESPMPTSNQRRNSGRRDSAERGSTSDDAAAAREIQWFPGKPEEYLSFGLQAANQNGLGQRRESSKL